MFASSRGLVALALLLLASACDSGPPPPPPDLVADVQALRRVMIDDPALRPLSEVERVADDRPVFAARLLASGALPAARRQVTRMRAVSTSTPEGRTYRQRLADAYEQRVRGLEQWHAYLEDAATSDADLLESITTRREAEIDLLEIDQELERYVPTEPPRRPPATEGEAEPAPEEPGDGRD